MRVKTNALPVEVLDTGPETVRKEEVVVVAFVTTAKVQVIWQGTVPMRELRDVDPGLPDVLPEGVTTVGMIIQGEMTMVEEMIMEEEMTMAEEMTMGEEMTMAEEMITGEETITGEEMTMGEETITAEILGVMILMDMMNQEAMEDPEGMKSLKVMVDREGIVLPEDMTSQEGTTLPRAMMLPKTMMNPKALVITSLYFSTLVLLLCFQPFF